MTFEESSLGGVSTFSKKKFYTRGKKGKKLIKIPP